MRTLNIALVVAFLASVTAPAVGFAVRAARGGESAVLAQENRVAAPFPDPRTATSPRAFTQGIERWMADRFAFRAELLALHRKVRDETGIGGAAQQAVVGTDGWLFLNQGALDDYLGLAAPDPAVTQSWRAGLKRLDTEARAKNARFVALIAPDKQTVYGENLPAGYVRTTQGTRAERVAPLIAADGIPLVTLDETLRGAKAQGQLYHRTDTHWTGLGAYVAYRALMARLAADGVQAPVLARERLVLRTVPGQAGDIVPMLGAGAYTEARLEVAVTNPTASAETTARGAQADETYWPRTYTQDLPGAPTLLVSGDSFIDAMLPYLKESFARIVVVRREPVVVRHAELMAHGADVVLFETVEWRMVNPLEIRP